MNLPFLRRNSFRQPGKSNSFRQSAKWPKRAGQGLLAAALFALGALWGSGALRLVPRAWADDTIAETPQAFLAGGERAEIVLKEIAGLLRDDIVIPLKQIEARLARIEEIAEGGGREAPAPRRRTNGAGR